MSFKKKFNIGSLVLSNNILYAPLAEYSDFAFRRFIRHYHDGLIFCEMIKMEALVREKSMSILKYSQELKPIGAQICGSNPNIAKDAAKIIEDLGFDIIDLNCGCPVPKIVKDGSGAAMLKNPSLIFQILNNIKASVKIPVSVKIRIGWDENSVCAKEIVKIAEDAGCAAITIHGRTKKQGYSGKSDWSYIKECKDIASEILVIGNGDLYTPNDVDMIFNQTKCDGVMISRGMLQTPNLSTQIENYFENNKTFVSKFDKKSAILKYIEYCIEEKGIEKTIFDIRKMCGWLFRDVKNIKQLRIDINSTSSVLKAIDLINNFDWIVDNV